MEELEDTYDERKRKECNPLSVKPTLSEMFFEATNQLRGTEMTSEQIRNYTLSRYNVDVIKCMKDINMLTRFSEIKVPNTAPRNTTKYSKKLWIKPKTVRRVTSIKAKKAKFPKTRKIKDTRKVMTKKYPRTRRLMGKRKNYRISARGNTKSKKQDLRSRISLIRLIRNGTAKKKEASQKNGFYARNTPNNKSISSPRSQNSHHDKLTKTTRENAVGDISIQNGPDPPAESATYGETTTSVSTAVDSKVPTGDKSKRYGTSQNGISDLEHSSANQTSAEATAKQNGRTHSQDILKSESKIMKAGYAVKSFIEDLGTKYASGLMFSNHRNGEKPQGSNNDDMQEKRFVHRNLRQVKIDLIPDDKRERKINNDSEQADLQSNKANTDFDLQRKNANTEADKVHADKIHKNSQGDKSIDCVGKDSRESSEKVSLMRNTLSTEKVSAGSKNTASLESSAADSSNTPVVINPGNSKKLLEDKMCQTLKVDKGINATMTKETDEIKNVRNKPLPKIKNEKSKIVKNPGSWRRTIISRNQNKTEPKKKTSSFRYGRKPAKEISKQRKRTLGGTPSGSSTPNIKKKTSSFRYERKPAKEISKQKKRTLGYTPVGSRTPNIKKKTRSFENERKPAKEISKQKKKALGNTPVGSRTPNIKKKTCSFEKERKPAKEISKQKKRTLSDTLAGSSTPNIKKKAKTDMKRSNDIVRFGGNTSPGCEEEKSNGGKLKEEENAPKKDNNNKGNRIDKPKELVERKKLKKRVE